MNKIYSPINWENYPSGNTPINEDNLNKMDTAINELDNRVISQDTVKANKTELSNLIKEWVIDETTGVITLTKYNGEQVIFDLNIEKVPVSFYLDDDGILYMTTDDGTTFSANIGSMIPVLTFNSSDTIAVSVSGTGVNKTYSFSIKTASVTEDLLQPNFLADIQTEANNAELSSSNAKNYATQAQSYAVGGTGSRTGEDTDNAKYYKEQVQAMHEDYTRGQVTGVKGNNETSYRSGNVNLTADNIGAATKADVTEAASKIQTTCTVTNLATAGWYRIARCKKASVNGLELLIKQSHNYDNGMFARIWLSTTTEKRRFKVIESINYSATKPSWSKVRFVFDDTYAYIEVYYGLSNPNSTLFELNNPRGFNDNTTWVALTPTLTAETVDGATVVASCDIPFDVTPANSEDLAEVQNGLLEVNGKGSQLNTSILAKALELPVGVYNYALASDYADISELPASNYRYNNATIYKRNSSSISIVLWGLATSATFYPPQINTWKQTSEGGWSGWKAFAITDDINALSILIGDKNYISTLGDGTVTSAISAVNGKVSGISATLVNKANGDSSGNAVNSNKWGNYQLRTGTSGASGYITFETE